MSRVVPVTGDGPLRVVVCDAGGGLTFRRWRPVGVDGPFHLLHFPAGPPVAVVQPMTTSLYLEGDSDIGRYETAFGHLRAEALDAEATKRHIHDLIKDRCA